jgi:TPR repeat protein
MGWKLPEPPSDPYAFNAARGASEAEYFLVMPHDDVVLQAESGVLNAQRYLGYECARSAREEDLAAAAKWFSLGVKQGDPECANGLALLLLNGQGGLQRDVPRAISLFEYAGGKFCEMGYFNLSNAYLDGNGVQRDPQHVKAIYELMAANGSVRAMRCLAGFHFHGLGGKRNYVSSYYWLRRSVKANVAASSLARGFIWTIDISLVLAALALVIIALVLFRKITR